MFPLSALVFTFCSYNSTSDFKGKECEEKKCNLVVVLLVLDFVLGLALLQLQLKKKKWEKEREKKVKILCEKKKSQKRTTGESKEEKKKRNLSSSLVLVLSPKSLSSEFCYNFVCPFVWPWKLIDNSPTNC